MKTGTPKGTPKGVVQRSRVNRPRSELRDLLLNAGLEILLEEGLGNGAEHVTFKKVFERVQSQQGIRVTNASVIGRIWENQSEFQVSVLHAAPQDLDQQEVVKTLDAVSAVLTSADLSTPKGRLATLQEVTRIASKRNAELMTGSSTWAIWIGMWAIAVSGKEDASNKRLREIVLASYEQTISSFSMLYEWIFSSLGIRIQEPFTMHHLTTAIGGLAEGIAMQEVIGIPGTKRVRLPSGQDGSAQDWTLLGVGIAALLDRMTELDPDWKAL